MQLTKTELAGLFLTFPLLVGANTDLFVKPSLNYTGGMATPSVGSSSVRYTTGAKLQAGAYLLQDFRAYASAITIHWDNADLQGLGVGADKIFNLQDTQTQGYIGALVGAYQFKTDLTDNNKENTTGYSFHGGLIYPKIHKSFDLETGISYTKLDVTTNSSAKDYSHTLEHLISLEIGVGYRF